MGRLFVPFDRLGANLGAGAGLGMALARGLAEAMGGRSPCTAPSGTGTTVEVAVPAA